MPEMTVIAEFETLEGAEPEFLRLLTDHAERTLHEEDGCLRFEIVKPVDREGASTPNRLIANELYVDQPALEAHTRNPRMEALLRAAEPLLKSRKFTFARSLGERAVEQGIPPSDLNAANDD